LEGKKKSSKSDRKKEKRNVIRKKKRELDFARKKRGEKGGKGNLPSLSRGETCQGEEKKPVLTSRRKKKGGGSLLYWEGGGGGKKWGGRLRAQRKKKENLSSQGEGTRQNFSALGGGRRGSPVPFRREGKKDGSPLF